MFQFLTQLFPTRSLLGTLGKSWITEKEEEQMRRTLTPLLITKEELQKKNIDALDELIARGRYAASPLLRVAIHRFKYEHMSLCAKKLGELLNESTTGLLMPMPNNLNLAPVLCPVPLHWTRKFSRGFNQAELLAKEVNITQGYDLQMLLVRTRPTGHQAHRSEGERRTALKNAFRYSSATPPPPWVVLVDDVCTTGTTLSECAKILKQAGVKRVSGLVLAYG
jgi:ComF family protein